MDPQALSLKKTLSLAGFYDLYDDKFLFRSLEQFDEYAFTTLLRPQAAGALADAEKKCQRDRKEKQIARLTTALQNNQFAKGTALLFGVEKTKTMSKASLLAQPAYLMDGQNRVNAVVTSGVAVPMNVVIALYKDDDAMERDAARTDAHERRKNGDLAKVLGADKKYKLSQDATKRLIPSIGILVYNGLDKECPFPRTRDMSKDEQTDAVHHYGPFAGKFYNVMTTGSLKGTKEIRGGAKKDFMHTSLFACGMASVVADEKLAEEFWGNLVREGNPARTPEHALGDYVKRGLYNKPGKTNFAGGGGSQRRLLMAGCIAWDHKMRDRALTWEVLNSSVESWFAESAKRQIAFTFQEGSVAG